MAAKTNPKAVEYCASGVNARVDENNKKAFTTSAAAVATTFESSLRHTRPPNADRRRAWNSSVRIIGEELKQSKQSPPEQSEPLKPVLSYKVIPKAKFLSPSNFGSSPLVPQYQTPDVEVTAQCVPSTDVTPKTMQALKSLVDNLVNGLFNETEQFDVQGLERLRTAFKHISKDHLKNLKSGFKGNSNVNNSFNNAANINKAHQNSQETLYQTVMWCIVFQASIDMLSKHNESCTVHNLLELTWQYMENLRGILRPFIDAKNKDILFNKNQSNARGISDNLDHDKAAELDDTYSWSTYDSSEVVQMTLNLSKEREIDKKVQQIVPKLQDHASQASIKSNNFKEFTYETVDRCYIADDLGGDSSSMCSPPQVRNFHTSTAVSRASCFSTVSLSPTKVKIAVNREEKTEVGSRVNNKSVQFNSNSVHTLPKVNMTEVTVHKCEIANQTGMKEDNILQMYKAARRDLAVEANRYLEIFKNCQRLQQCLRNSSIQKADTELNIELNCIPGMPCLQKHSFPKYSTANPSAVTRNSVERFLYLTCEVAQSLPQPIRCLAKCSLQPDVEQGFFMRPELVCILATSTPLLSLVDLEWLMDQFRRSSSTKPFKKVHSTGSSDKIVRALPFNCGVSSFDRELFSQTGVAHIEKYANFNKPRPGPQH